MDTISKWTQLLYPEITMGKRTWYMSKPISGIASINYNPKRREKREVKSLRITIRSRTGPTLHLETGCLDVAYDRNCDPREDSRAQTPPLVGWHDGSFPSSQNSYIGNLNPKQRSMEPPDLRCQTILTSGLPNGRALPRSGVAVTAFCWLFVVQKPHYVFHWADMELFVDHEPVHFLFFSDCSRGRVGD